MTDGLLAVGTALWLGILVSISPCPLTTNIAAISFIGRRVDSTGKVLISGLLYTIGRVLTYVGLGMLIVMSLLSMPEVSMLLQKYMNKLLGPILIVVGMFLLELISFRLGKGGFGSGLQNRAESSGIWGALLLGVVFALSLCPVTAALFFGSLIPLAIQNDSGILLPAVFGVGTGLPVLLFALVIAFSAKSLGKIFNRLSQVEIWGRRITGSLFILAGIYYCLRFIFRLW
jgi:cytochrome c biogenesis protein CcdA